MILPHRCHATTADQRPRASITVRRQSADVCFEITDMVAVANLAQAATSLDDFGAGISCFAYLKHLTVDYVKIDGGFIKGILHSPTERAMVESSTRSRT